MISAPRLTLNDLLSLSGIEPERVVVLRHRPYEPQLNRVFEWLISERRDLFDCYQSTHGAKTESAIKRADYVVSCIRHPNKSALFVGLYVVASKQTLSVEQCMARPKHKELMSLGMSGIFATEGRTHLQEFHLRLSEWHSEWIGRLIFEWPGLERSWYRWAHRNEFAVRSIARESLLLPPMPRWDELAVTWAELAVLPQSWAAALSHWRGIYLIIDQSDGKNTSVPPTGPRICSNAGDHMRNPATGETSCSVTAVQPPFAFQFYNESLRIHPTEMSSNWSKAGSTAYRREHHLD